MAGCVILELAIRSQLHRASIFASAGEAQDPDPGVCLHWQLEGKMPKNQLIVSLAGTALGLILDHGTVSRPNELVLFHAGFKVPSREKGSLSAWCWPALPELLGTGFKVPLV